MHMLSTSSFGSVIAKLHVVYNTCTKITATLRTDPPTHVGDISPSTILLSYANLVWSYGNTLHLRPFHANCLSINIGKQHTWLLCPRLNAVYFINLCSISTYFTQTKKLYVLASVSVASSLAQELFLQKLAEEQFLSDNNISTQQHVFPVRLCVKGNYQRNLIVIVSNKQRDGVTTESVSR